MNTFSWLETKKALERVLPPSAVFYGWIALIAVLLIAYGQSTATIIHVWWNNPDSNHCFFVPLFAAALLWHRRDLIGAELSKDEAIQWWPVGAATGAVVGLVLFFTLGTWGGMWQSDWWQPVVAALYGATVGAMLVQIFPLWASRREATPSSGWDYWWALPLFVLWALMWWASASLSYQKTIPLSVVPFLAGVTIFLGGWRIMRWVWPALVYVTFMVPIPDALSGWLRGPLMRFGTVASVYIINTMGIPAVRAGDIIQLQGTVVNVAEACSGLRMLMLFFAICVGAAFWLRQRPLWERIVVVISAPIIAVLANVIRIVVTALLHHLHLGETADKFFHDWAGFGMMPVGLLMLWAEWTLLQKLFLEPAPERPLSLGGTLVGPPGAARANLPGGTRRKSAGGAHPNVFGVPRPNTPDQQIEDP